MIRNEFVLAVFAGVVLALPYLLYARLARDRRRVFAVGLLIAASVYVVSLCPVPLSGHCSSS